MPLNYKSGQWDPKTIQFALIGNVTVSGPLVITSNVTVNPGSYFPSFHTYRTIGSNTTLNVGGAGLYLHSINIGFPSSPTIVLYDSLTPSGAIFQVFGPNYPVGTHQFGASLMTGLTVDATAAGAVPQLTLMIK